MLKITLPVRLFALFGLLVLLMPLAVLAQGTQPTVLVNQVKDPEEIPQNPGVPFLKFDMIFTPLNADGSVITLPTDAQATQASLQISTGNFATALTPVTTPWSLALVIDNGGNMADAKASATFKSVKSSLAGQFGSSQSGTTMEAYTFSSTIQQVLAFKDSGDNQKVQKVINGIVAKPGTKFCMNDAVTQAVNDLAGATGRKAVLLFTASVDNCASQNAQQVVELAQRNKVEIFAVGLNGYVTQPQLDAITTPTGGIAYIKDPANLVFAFGNVTNIMAHQIEAIAKISPKGGQQDATLVLKLSDATTITSAPIPFTSPHDFIAQPFATLLGQIQPTKTGILFNMSYTSGEQIDKVQVTVNNKITGLTTFSQALDAHPDKSQFDTAQITVGINGLELGQAYDVTVQGLDGNGLPLGDPEKRDFTYQLNQLTIGIVKVDPPTLDLPQFTISVDPAKPPDVVKFKIFLTIGDDNTPAMTPLTIPVGEPLIIPADKLESGNYTVHVEAFDNGEGDQAKLLAEAPPVKVSFVAPTWFDKLIITLKTNPLALAAIGGATCIGVVGLVVVVWLIIPKGNSKVKEVEIFVPEKQRRIVPNTTSSGVFEKQDPPPQRERPRDPAPRERPAPQAAPQRAAPAPQAPAVNVPPAVLSAQTPLSAMLRTPIRRSPFSIGRRDGNDVVLKVDNSMGVSGQHCSISFRDGQFYVTDEGSSYGTTVNGKTIPKNQPVPLPDGAQLGLGPKVVLTFRLGQ